MNLSFADITNAVYMAARRDGTDIRFACATCLRREMDAVDAEMRAGADDEAGDWAAGRVEEAVDVDPLDVSIDLPRQPPMDEQPPHDPLDVSIDLSHRRADNEPEPVDTSMRVEPELPTDDELLATEPGIRYTILEKGSKRGGRLLVTNNGYSFGMKVCMQKKILIIIKS